MASRGRWTVAPLGTKRERGRQARTDWVIRMNDPAGVATARDDKAGAGLFAFDGWTFPKLGALRRSGDRWGP